MTSPATPPNPPAVPPAGWYEQHGSLRWWDGGMWGPWAPAAARTTEEARGKSLAVLSHLGIAAGGFILPLVLYLLEQGKPDRNRFVCHHACEALNFSITFMLAWFGAFVVFFTTTFATIEPGSDAAPPLSFLIMFPLMFVLMGSYWVLGILAMFRANEGVWWRYPVSLRLVGRGIDWRTASS